MTTIALATCAGFPNLDDEDRLLIPALVELGIAAEPQVWTDRSVDWSRFAAVVIRATWDYSDRHDDFIAWCEQVSADSLLLNRADLVRWNTDKRYLRALQGAGIPTVPTLFLEPGDAADAWHGEVIGEAPELVVKPAVSCGSRDTMRYSVRESAEQISDHVGRLLADGRVVMVQPYLEAVDTSGETALLYFDGAFSHAIRKGPLLALGVEGERVEGLFVQEQIDPREPTDDERAVGAQVLAAIPGDVPLYARVDLIAGPEGTPSLLELELTEPSLFLSFADGAPARLADAISRRLAR